MVFVGTVLVGSMNYTILSCPSSNCKWLGMGDVNFEKTLYYMV